jgi:hypothetical protein
MSVSVPASDTPVSKVVPLRYVARAGLLPELTRQTYDSLYKALREVILNSVDAGASHIVVDLSGVETDGTLEISDDGEGMALADLQQSFMSLGGSQKFDSADKFGRIGVGSLALMHYAQQVEIETKRTGSASVTKAVISHPWALDQTQRAQDLDRFRAGDAWEESARDRQNHFTVIRLRGVDDVLLRECADITAYYKLLERLRRILPLGWPDGTQLAHQLSKTAPDLTHMLRAHTAAFSARVSVRSRWSDELLTKRVYGDGTGQDEGWNGAPRPILTNIVVDEGDRERTLTVAGYLISQARPSVEWTGLTARVQNVAVEERTFFDLESDPGFRKYISGEVWLLGELDRARLINIDRASFSREAADYRAAARLMQGELQRFKVECVQAPQRAKVAIKRRLDQQVAVLETAKTLSSAVSENFPQPPGRFGFPSSNNGSIRVQRARGLLDDLQQLGAIVALDTGTLSRARPYRLQIASDGRRVLVTALEDLLRPVVILADRSYELQLVEGRPKDPPLIIKNRPRALVFNLAHPAFGGELRQASLQTLLTLELAYLVATGRADEDLYDCALALIASA